MLEEGFELQNTLKIISYYKTVTPIGWLDCYTIYLQTKRTHIETYLDLLIV